MHVDIHDNAIVDLRRLKSVEPRAAATILATLEQIEADPNAIDKLTTHGDNHIGVERLGVKRW